MNAYLTGADGGGCGGRRTPLKKRLVFRYARTRISKERVGSELRRPFLRLIKVCLNN